MTRVHRLIAVALLAGGPLTAGCGDDPPATDDGDGAAGTSPGDSAAGGGDDGGDDAIRIAGLFNLTGPAAVVGVPERQGAELMVARINDAGGVDGRMLELEVRDAESNPDTAVRLARDLVREEVDVVLGPTLSSLCEAARQVTEPAGVATFCVSPIPEPSELVFVIEYSAESILASIPAKWLSEQGMTRVACLHAADTSGQAYLATLQKVSADFGIELVAVESFQPGDADVTAQLTRIRRADPDVVFSCASGGDHITVLQGMRQLGMDQPVLLGAGGVSFNVAEQAADVLPSGGVYSVGSSVLVADQLPETFSGREEAIEFADAYEEQYGKRPDTNSAYAADSVQIIAEGMKLADGDDGEAIATGMEQVCDLQGVLTAYCLSADDHSGYQLKQPIIVRWTDTGDFELEEVLDPDGIAGRA